MVRTFSCNGNTGAPVENAMSTGLTAGKTTQTWEISEAGGGTGTGVGQPNTLDTNVGCLYLSSLDNEPNVTSWDSGTWTVQIDIATGSADVDWYSVYVQRMTSSDTFVESIGSVSGTGDLPQTMSASANYTCDVSGASSSNNADDQIYVVCGFSDTRGAGSHGTVDVTMDQTDTLVIAPFSPPAQNVTVSAIAAGTAIVAPELEFDQFVAVPAIAAGTAIVAPDQVNRAITAPAVDAGTAIVAPGVTQVSGQNVAVPAIAASAVIVAPDQVNRTIAVSPVAASATIVAPAVIKGTLSAFKGRVRLFTLPTSSTVDITGESGDGTCKGGVLFMVNATSQDTETAGGGVSITIFDGSGNMRSQSTMASDASASSTAFANRRDTDSGYMFSTAVPPAAEANVSSIAFITDGIRLTCDDYPAETKECYAVLFFGSDAETAIVTISPNASADGESTQAHGMTNTPDFCVSIRNASATADSNNSHCLLEYGIAAKDQGGTIYQGGQRYWAPNSIPVECRSIIGDQIGWNWNAPGANRTYEVTTIDGTNIGITTRGTTGPTDRVFHVLAVSVAGSNDSRVTLIENNTMPSGTGDWAIGSVGFKPGFAMGCLTALTSWGTTSSNFATDGTAGSFGWFAVDDRPTPIDACAHYNMEDAVSTTNTGSTLATKPLALLDHQGSSLVAGTFVSWDANGLTFNVTTANASESYILLVEQGELGTGQNVAVPAIAAGTAIVGPDQVDQTVPTPAIAAGTAIVAPDVAADQFVAAGPVSASATIVAPDQVNRGIAAGPVSASAAIVAPDQVNRAIAAPATAAGTAINAPDVAADQFVAVPPIAAGTAIVAPDQVNQTVPTPATAAGTAIVAPDISQGQAIAVPAIAAGTAIVGPDQVNRAIAVGPVSASAVIVAPELGAQLVAVPAIAAGTAIVAPDQVNRAIAAPAISASAVVVAPDVAADQFVAVSAILATAAIVAPGVASSVQNVAVPAIAAGTAIVTPLAFPICTEREFYVDINLRDNVLREWRVHVLSVTGATTLDETHHVVLCDSSGGAFTVTLPAVSGITGRRYYLKKTDSSANAITVDGNGSETIDGSTTKPLAIQYESLELVADSSGWHIL